MSEDENKRQSPAIMGGLGVVANLAQVAALVFATRLEWLALAGVAALVFGLVALFSAIQGNRKVVAALAGLVLFVSGVLITYGVRNQPADDPVAAPSASSLPAQSAGSAAPPGDPSRGPEPGPETAEPGPAGTWYNLTAYRSVDYGNGHDSENSITIGTKAFPNSIRGSYPSSTADPDNFRTWALAGRCTQLSVWVGKDAASRDSAGTGRFIVRNGDAEIRAAEATMADPPRHLEVDVTGVVRLTLLDTRGRLDADNAWGTPRVLCSAPPGTAR